MRSLFAVLALASACGSSSKSATDAAPAAVVEMQRFSDDLTTVTGTRAQGSSHWQEIQEMCASRFAALGFTVERHAYGTGTNVVGTLTGTTTPTERVLVSAHYDSVNNCAGADDNASGVAATFETARVLAATPHARTLVVACWDQEEAGLIGSKAYAQRAKAAGDQIVANFVFETIAYRSSEPDSQMTDASIDAAFPAQSAAIKANDSKGDFILIIHDERNQAPADAFIAAAAEIYLPTIVLPVADTLKKASLAAGLRRSDHAGFWDVDLPGLMITDTADYRNPHYHCSGGPDAIADLDLAFATLDVRATVAAATTMLQ